MGNCFFLPFRRPTTMDTSSVDNAMIEMAKELVESRDLDRLYSLHKTYRSFCNTNGLPDEDWFDVILHCIIHGCCDAIFHFVEDGTTDLYAVLENCAIKGSYDTFIRVHSRLKDSRELTQTEKEYIMIEAIHRDSEQRDKLVAYIDSQPGLNPELNGYICPSPETVSVVNM